MKPHQKRTKLPVIGLILSSRLLLYTIVELLQPQDISQLIKAFSNTGQYCNHLVSVLEGLLFVREHLWKCSRDVYFDIYQEPRFTIIEKSIIAQQVENNPIFRQLLLARNHLRQLQPSNQQVFQSLEIFADDPPIPMAKLIRENIGLGCSTNHQQSHTDKEHQWLLDYHQERQNIYIQNLTAHLQSESYSCDKVFKNKNCFNGTSNKPILDKINTVCFQPHHITYSNMSQYCIQENELHNFIVSLYALTDLVVASSMEYVNGIQEPYHKFVEFCLRYEMFRNFVIAVQEQFSPLLTMYLQICDQCFVGSQTHSVNFWKSAFRKWVDHMSIFHSTCISTLIRQNTKLRHQNILSKLQQICNAPDEDKKNLNNFQNLNIDQIFPLQMSVIQQVYELVSQEFPFCSNSFNNYMMDISIDQNSVFWCGHQQQKVGIFYEEFQNQLLCANQTYYGKIVKACGKDLYRKIVQEDLQFVGTDEMYKEKTVIKFVCQANQTLNSLGLPSIQVTIQNKYKQLQQQIQRSNAKLGIPMLTQQSFSSSCYQIKQLQHENHSILMKPSPNNGTLDTNDTYKLEPEFDSSMEEEKNPFPQEDDDSSFMQDQSQQMPDNSDQEPFQPPSSSAFPQWVL